MERREMTQTIENREVFLSYHPLTLILGDTRRSMGRVSRLQGSNLPGGLAREGITHAVGFLDGENLRSTSRKGA